MFDRAITRAAERVGDPTLLAWSAHLRAGLCLSAGDIEEMNRCWGIAWELAERVDHPLLKWQRAVMQCLCALVAGEVDEAEARATEAVEVGTANGEPDVKIFALNQFGAVMIQRGELEDSVSAIEQLGHEFPIFHDCITARLAWEHARCGRLGLARVMLDEFAAIDFEHRHDPTWYDGMVSWARVAVACRDQDSARSIYGLLAPFAEQVSTNAITPLAPVNHLLGELATVFGDYDRADDHFASAAAFEARAGAAYFAAETDISWSKMLIERDGTGDPDRARTRLVQARSVAATCGYRDLERDATDLLLRLK